jgi:MFS family permease
MIFGLLATELPPDRRSAALNLVYLPLYAAGIIGPAAGAVVASLSGVYGLFIVGGCVFLFGAATILLRRSEATRVPAGGSAETPGPSVASEL